MQFYSNTRNVVLNAEVSQIIIKVLQSQLLLKQVLSYYYSETDFIKVKYVLQMLDWENNEND